MHPGRNAVARYLRRQIGRSGPISVERYMEIALTLPRHGYYTKGGVFGVAGDFTTAPEISQMFGELIGLWCVAVWEAMGAPAAFRWIELGPGRGTLLADAWRATGLRPAFRQAARLCAVETSPALRHLQKEQWTKLSMTARWFDQLDDIPTNGPALIIANEFFDALPSRQYVGVAEGWRERLVSLDNGQFVFKPSLVPPQDGIALPPLAKTGAIYECSPARAKMARSMARRIVVHGGAALILDYGYEGPAIGDTLQALRAHKTVHPLAEPGMADLTTHVDFSEIARASASEGVKVQALVSQGAFLKALGIEARAAKLKHGQPPDAAAAVDAALGRLTADEEMGSLFQVMALAHPSCGQLPGFP